MLYFYFKLNIEKQRNFLEKYLFQFTLENFLLQMLKNLCCISVAHRTKCWTLTESHNTLHDTQKLDCTRTANCTKFNKKKHFFNFFNFFNFFKHKNSWIKIVTKFSNLVLIGKIPYLPNYPFTTFLWPSVIKFINTNSEFIKLAETQKSFHVALCAVSGWAGENFNYFFWRSLKIEQSNEYLKICPQFPFTWLNNLTKTRSKCTEFVINFLFQTFKFQFSCRLFCSFLFKFEELIEFANNL